MTLLFRLDAIRDASHTEIRRNSNGCMQMSLSAHPSLVSPTSQRRLPAWVVSLCIHAVLFVLLGVFMRPQRVGMPADSEPQRESQVVLVRNTDGKQTEYFLDSSPDEKSAENTEENEVEKASDSRAASAQSPLPPAAAAKALVNLETDLPLPRQHDIGDSGNLLVTPNLTGGSGRPFLPGPSDAEFISAEQALRAARGPKGDSVGVSLFSGPPAEGRSFVFVIDRSRSMGEEGLGALNAAANELATQLAALKSNHTFQIIAYHHIPLYMSDERDLLEATGANKNLGPTFIREISAFGGTNHEVALLAALRLETDVIFFMTDGGDPYLSAGQMERIRRRASGKTAIHCVQFGFGDDPPEEKFMQELAAQNAGGYSYVNMRKKR